MQPAILRKSFLSLIFVICSFVNFIQAENSLENISLENLSYRNRSDYNESSEPMSFFAADFLHEKLDELLELRDRLIEKKQTCKPNKLFNFFNNKIKMFSTYLLFTIFFIYFVIKIL